MRPANMLRHIRQPSLTASSRAMPPGTICCSWATRCNPLPVRMRAVVWAIQNIPMCAGSPARPAMPAPTIIDAPETMKNKILICFVLFSLLLAVSCRRKVEAPADNHVVRCAVIGGMTMTGLWPEITKLFEAQTGYRVEVVATGPRPLLDTAMRAGKVDLLTMHS